MAFSIQYSIIYCVHTIDGLSVDRPGCPSRGYGILSSSEIYVSFFNIDNIQVGGMKYFSIGI